MKKQLKLPKPKEAFQHICFFSAGWWVFREAIIGMNNWLFVGGLLLFCTLFVLSDQYE